MSGTNYSNMFEKIILFTHVKYALKLNKIKMVKIE